MKKTILIISLFFLVWINLFSRKSENNISSGYLNVDGGKLYYEIAGKGENIVLIHDGLLHNEVWDNQFPVFSKNYRVIRYDRRGYGKSPNSTASYTNVDDLNQLFLQLKIDKAILFGMSAGGGCAIDFALKYPEKTTALVLVGAVVSGYGYSNHMMTRGGRIDLSSDFFSDTKKFIRYFGWDDPYGMYSENIKAKEKYLKLLETNPQNVSPEKYKFMKGLERPAQKFLSEIKVPTLILVGEFDIPDVHAHSGVIETGITGSKREIISKAGHLIPLEQPESFNAAVIRFLYKKGFTNLLNSRGVEAAVQYLKKEYESNPEMKIFTERELNSMGYDYLLNGKTKDAIELFKLNTIYFPKSGNVYDSLGEAYLKDGQNELAIKNYEKSLQLNQQNTNAVEQLKKLREH